MGEISKHEVKEVNRLNKDGIRFMRSNKEPALLIGMNTYIFAAYLGAGMFFGLGGRFYNRYNNLWVVGAFLPASMYLIANYFAQ